ncbi:MAG: APC family permease [Propionibacteriaceae bacterium]|nr:APC family permease [Propionibacteriaceae bacterium]
MAHSRTNVFATTAVGATKQISPLQTLIYSVSNPGLMFALVYLMWAPYLYPGAHMVYAIITVVQMFVIAGLYWLMSVAMPRSGGEYIYISRIIHPAVGLLSSFMITLTAISWTGVLTDWWIKWSVVDFFRGVAIVNNNDPTWMGIADALSTNWVRAIIGVLAIGFILLIYYKGITWMVKVSIATLIATIVGAVVFLVAMLASGGREKFASNWTSMTGLDYSAVIPTAAAAGNPTTFLVMPTIMAGSTYIILNTLGSTFGANLAGEVRNVQKSQLLALFGSLGILMVVWAVFYGLAYSSFGGIWTNSLMFLYNSNNAAYPWGGSEPFATLLVGILTGSPVFVALIALAFLVATFGSATGLGFGPTRNFVAWANDRIFPKSYAERNPKTKAPMRAVYTVIGIALIFFLLDVFAPDWTADISYTIFTWFLAWICLGVAGAIFPYRKKLLFESSPPVVKIRILGIPLITILGVLTTIISCAICIYLLIPFVRGDIPPTMLIVSLGIAVIGLIIYFSSRARNKARGIDLKYQVMEIPAD